MFFTVFLGLRSDSVDAWKRPWHWIPLLLVKSLLLCTSQKWSSKGPSFLRKNIELYKGRSKRKDGDGNGALTPVHWVPRSHDRNYEFKFTDGGSKEIREDGGVRLGTQRATSSAK